jgi:hypothetical protein
MRKVLTALLAAVSFAATTALLASTANAQVDAWNGGWHVGGDYYAPTYSSYDLAPVYDYAPAPVYSTPAYSYGSAPLYDYGSAPAYSTAAYGYGAAPLVDYGAAPAYGMAAYGYGAAPLYNYGAAPAYGPAVVGAQMQPVRTVEIVRTVYLPARSGAGRRIALRRTAIQQTAEAAHARPQQDRTASNVAAGADRAHSLYDTAAAPAPQQVAARTDAHPAYRFVYQRDRILMIDPSTNTVVQTLRR